MMKWGVLFLIVLLMTPSGCATGKKVVLFTLDDLPMNVFQNKGVIAGCDVEFKFFARKLGLPEALEELFLMSEDPVFVAFSKAAGRQGSCRKLDPHGVASFRKTNGCHAVRSCSGQPPGQRIIRP